MSTSASTPGWLKESVAGKVEKKAKKSKNAMRVTNGLNLQECQIQKITEIDRPKEVDVLPLVTIKGWFHRQVGMHVSTVILPRSIQKEIRGQSGPANSVIIALIAWAITDLEKRKKQLLIQGGKDNQTSSADFGPETIKEVARVDGGQLVSSEIRYSFKHPTMVKCSVSIPEKLMQHMEATTSGTHNAVTTALCYHTLNSLKKRNKALIVQAHEKKTASS